MLPFIVSLVIAVGVVFLFGLTPERVARDMMGMICPKRTLRNKVQIQQGKKQTGKLALEAMRIQEAMRTTGKEKQFMAVCAASVVCLLAGTAISVIIGNLFLLPVLAIALAAIPFLYAKRTVSYYTKHIEDEMETALSVITTAYVRNQDIIVSIEENITYLRPPVQGIFQEFLVEAKAIRADVKQAIRVLKGKIDNTVFQEWCDALVQCQEDRTLIDTLQPVVNKLTDLRIVKNEMKTVLMEPRKEYWTMAAFLIGNIPLLRFMNEDWYQILMGTLPGQIVLAVCGGSLFITAALMLQYTRPLQYRQNR